MIGASAPGVVTNVEQLPRQVPRSQFGYGKWIQRSIRAAQRSAGRGRRLCRAGQTVGYLRNQQNIIAEGPNLYFEVLKDGAPVNPMDL